jgi:hypothetical protein
MDLLSLLVIISAMTYKLKHYLVVNFQIIK